MNKIPLVSVIIPMYNAQNYIFETIQSVINQTYPNWEMLIIDNCSTDQSKEIVKKVNDPRIKVLTLEANSGGPARPRNIGIGNANGEYLAFLDADDVWHNDKLEKQIHYLKINKANFTSSNCTFINETSEDTQLSRISSFFNKVISKKTLCDVIKNNFIITSSVMLHKEIALKFNETDNFISVEDYDLWLRVLSLKNTKYQYQDEYLLKYRIVENSASQRFDTLRQELKSNIVLANFILDHNEYIWCWYNRIFFHLFRKQVKKLLGY